MRKNTDRVRTGQLLQIRLNGNEISSSVLLHDKAKPTVFGAYIVGKQAKEKVVVHLLQVIVEGGGG